MGIGAERVWRRFGTVLPTASQVFFSPAVHAKICKRSEHCARVIRLYMEDGYGNKTLTAQA